MESPDSSSRSSSPPPSALFECTEGVKEYMNFDDMNLSDELLRGIYAYGFESPSPIQRKAIVPMVDGKSIIAQAQAGTGKTGAFVIGSLMRIDPKIKAPQVIILSPTRELTQQTEAVARSISTHMGITVHSATGGPPITEDIKALQRGAQFIVGTPGRVYALIRRRALLLDNIRVLILDEADQMLENKFKEQIMCILEFKFPHSTQVGLFSATMPIEVIDIAERLAGDDAIRILINPEKLTLEGVKQYYVELDQEDWKFEALYDLYQNLNINQLIIFVNKRQKAEWLAYKMKEKGFTLECIHGDMDVSERRTRMNEFRSGQVRVLISTDLLARGIDVQQVSMVINYDFPIDRENYLHRIFRAGRFLKKGVAINFVSGEEFKMMKEAQKYFNLNIGELPNNLAALTV
jgi:translation initiation factor 4A